MRVFISARFFSFFLLLLRRVSARVRLFSLHTLSFRISRKKESRVRKRGTRAPRISETELRLFGGTPTFLLGLFSRLPRIYTQISLIVALNQDLGWLRAFVPAYFFSSLLTGLLFADLKGSRPLLDVPSQDVLGAVNPNEEVAGPHSPSTSCARRPAWGSPTAAAMPFFRVRQSRPI